MYTRASLHGTVLSYQSAIWHVKISIFSLITKNYNLLSSVITLMCSIPCMLNRLYRVPVLIWYLIVALISRAFVCKSPCWSSCAFVSSSRYKSPCRSSCTFVSSSHVTNHPVDHHALLFLHHTLQITLLIIMHFCFFITRYKSPCWSSCTFVSSSHVTAEFKQLYKTIQIRNVNDLV